MFHHPRPASIRGALRGRHDTRGGMRWTRCVMRRMTLSRTAKSCGSGAPTLALSLAGKIVLRGDGGKKARSPGRSRISRKTIAQGMPVVAGEPVVANACAFCCTRGRGCIGHPAFPAPSPVSRVNCCQRLGHFVPRERGATPHPLPSCSGKAGHPVRCGLSAESRAPWNTGSSGHPRSSRGQASDDDEEQGVVKEYGQAG
jgi:hypothetical protein